MSMKNATERFGMYALTGVLAALAVFGLWACKQPAGNGNGSGNEGGKTIPVTGVSLDKNAITLTVGETETLSATLTPENATNKAVAWASSDADVATVSGGTVGAVKAGDATITVTTADGGKTATCAVTVNKVEESFEITFTADAAPLITGPTIHLSSTNGVTTATLTVANSEQYSVIDWLDMNGTHRQGASFTLKSADYQSAGEYVLTVEVIKDGIPYNRTITFTVAD